jgi:hypothetical protein
LDPHQTKTMRFGPLLVSSSMPRRRALAWLAWCAVPLPAARAAEDGRELDFVVDPAGFGNAGAADILAVARSAAGEIWQHCATTRFRHGFRLVHDPRFPITHFARSDDGRIVIGLAVEGTYWARLAYQFTHEFCHALMDHSNDSSRLWRETRHANQWLAESLCETASLFALRAMARSWRTAPPYPNWRDYAVHLGDYARARIEDPRHRLPEGRTFAQWFAAVEPAQRAGWTRENNTIIAKELLPLFERRPAGWDALAAIHLCRRDRGMSLAAFLAEWRRNSAPRHHGFIGEVAALFGVSAEPGRDRSP